MKEQKRYLLIDGIRGLAIVNMVAFHFLYDVNEIWNINSHWYEEKAFISGRSHFSLFLKNMIFQENNYSF